MLGIGRDSSTSSDCTRESPVLNPILRDRTMVKRSNEGPSLGSGDGASPPHESSTAASTSPPASNADDGRPRSIRPPDPVGASWTLPLLRFERAWTAVEAKVCAGVLVAEIFALCAWIVLKGLSTPTSVGTKSGLVFRAVLGAVAVGAVVHLVTRRRSIGVHRTATTAAVFLGLFTGKLWTDIGITYFSNILNWLQDASSLTLIGGLRGLGTRLTVLLAMLGASLAAANAKHINIDVLMRFLKPQARIPLAVCAWIATSLVCVVAAWGFTDHISIESYNVDRNASRGAKFAAVVHHTGEGMFMLRKQIGLDLSTLPVVLKGKRYDTWLTNGEWTSRIKDAGWEKHFSPEQVAALATPPDVASETRVPLVVLPDGNARGVLVHLLNMVFPLGFLIIALRFLLRALLAMTGHVRVDPDAAYDEFLEHDSEVEGVPPQNKGVA